MLEFNGTILFVIISFIIFVFLMNLLCYKPLLRVMQERENFFEKNKNTVFETNSKKENVIKEIEQEISKAHLESSKLLKMAANKCKQEKEIKIQAKKAEISNSLVELEDSLNNDSAAVKQQLKTEVENYVKSLVSRVLSVDFNEVKVDNEKVDRVLR